MKKIIIFVLFATNFLIAQNIKGNFKQTKNNEIVLKGFEGQKETELAKTQTDSLGNFQLSYPKEYIGAALLQIKNSKTVIVLLNQENLSIQWDNLEDFNSLKYTNSPENDAFTNGMLINQQAEQKLSGLKFLVSLYKNNPKQQKWLQQEIKNQEQQFQNFLNNQPKKSYTKYYLKIRKLITDFPITASRYMERISQHESDFNTINFDDQKLYHSGLTTELFEGYFKLMESHTDKDKMYPHINTSVDAIIKSLSKNNTLQQEIAQEVFKMFERRSLFPAAEHLALAMLDSQSCQLTPERTALFEQYRKMGVGQTAPDIDFANSKSYKTKLSEINSKYRLIVFAASWCEKCKEEMPKLKASYNDWKTKYDLEIILNSLDTYNEQYENFTKDFSWISTSDYKSWEGKTARDYFVFGTPTMYLLDNNNKILLKPRSLEHLEAWLVAFDKK